MQHGFPCISWKRPYSSSFCTHSKFDKGKYHHHKTKNVVRYTRWKRSLFVLSYALEVVVYEFQRFSSLSLSDRTSSELGTTKIFYHHDHIKANTCFAVTLLGKAHGGDPQEARSCAIRQDIGGFRDLRTRGEQDALSARLPLQSNLVLQVTHITPIQRIVNDSHKNNNISI